MIIAISSDQDNLNCFVSDTFGRCHWFCLHNTQTKETIFFKNPFLSIKQNAGIEVVDFLSEQNVDAVMACRFGSMVTAALIKKGIQIIIPQKPKTLTEIINQIKK